MTDKEFLHQFRRGIGSAIVELRQNENRLKYKEIVFRCCLKDIGYDTQSEGTKGHYIALILIFFFGGKPVKIFSMDFPLIFVLLFVCGMGLSTNWRSPWSMTPDTVECTELKTGKRNEGTIYGIVCFVSFFIA